MRKQILAPSLLAADFADLHGALKIIEARGGNAVHIDVMDGAFVPEISYGEPVVRSLRPCSTLPFDVHLMVEHPERHIESFALAGADWITIHFEAARIQTKEMLSTIKSLGKKAGISIKPHTKVQQIESFLPLCDIVLVMTVEPGFGGQSLITDCLKKVQELCVLRKSLGLNFLISVDGGVNEKTLTSVLDAGVDIVVSGSSFFNGTLNW